MCVVLACAVAFGVAGQAGAEKVWREQDGIVTIEVESVDAKPNAEKWKLVTEPEGYTGDGYLVWTTWGNMYKDPLVYDALEGSDAVLTYRVWIDNPGTYAIHIRNYHHEEDGDNDVWVSIDKERYVKVWDHHVEDFTWTEFDMTTWRLDEGVHEIAVGGRSKGFGIDRIVLHKTDLDEPVWGDPRRGESPLVEASRPDDRSPSAPTNVRVGERRTSSAELRWDEAKDNHRVLEYVVYLDGRRRGATLDTSYTLHGLPQKSVCRATVRARDIAGNLSAPSEPVELATRQFNPLTDIEIKYVKERPQIDGEFDSVWHRQIQHPITNLVDGRVDSKEDLTGYFRCAWDDENLYFVVEVHDDVRFPELEEGAKSWEQDGIRLLLDPQHDQAPRFGLSHRVYRFIGKDDRIRESIQRDDYVEGVEAKLGDQPPAKRSWHEEPKGYFVEMVFPWTTLGVTPEENALLGFEVVVQDNDATQAVEARMSRAGKGESPSQFATARLVREMPSGSSEGWLPKQIWKERDGFVVVEAEAIEHHSNWVLMTEPTGYTGEGYLLWQGPNRSETPDGRGGNDDYTNERQGPQEEWLIVRVDVTHPGEYRVDARNIHEKEDGDNDAWVWVVGRPISDWDPVRRMGDSLKDGEGFTWLDWGVRKFELEPGVNNLYIGGRSRGFGIDRIAIYRDGDGEAREQAKDLNTPTSLSERSR